MTDIDESSQGVVFEAVTSLEGKVLGEILEGIKPEIKQKHNSPDVISEKIDATAAFEIFAGRRYWGSSKDEDAFKNELNNRIANNNNTKINNSPALQRIESPMERYQRLRVEMAEFENDIRAVESAVKSGKEDNNKIVDGFLPKVKTGINELMQQLASLEGKPGLGPLLLSQTNSSILHEIQNDLSNNIKNNIEELKQKGGGDSNDDSTKNVLNDTDRNQMLQHAALEERINRLEKFLGSQNNSNSSSSSSSSNNNNNNNNNNNSNSINNNSSVLKILNDLEQKMNALTPGFLDSIHRRSKILAQELDAVSKKMKRYGSEKKGETDQEKEKIIKLYDKMAKYDYVSEEIPVIVDRLQSVERLHKQSLNFDQKLMQLEQAQLSCLEYLKRDEEILNNLEQSMLDNTTIMEKNINMLDQKFQNL